VNPIRPKAPRLQLDPVSYEALRQQVLRRDGWRCQSCGAMSNLEVHHKEFRSHSGDDSELNLITLCSVCHSPAHRGGSSAAYGRRAPQASLTDPEGEAVHSNDKQQLGKHANQTSRVGGKSPTR